MTHHDTLSDMLTRIRNANLVQLSNVDLPVTKITKPVAKILQREGFIKSFILIDKTVLRLTLKTSSSASPKRAITSLKRISKPGLRVYVTHKNIPKVLGGIGIALISTPKGILTDHQARSVRMGGEVLCHIW